MERRKPKLKKQTLVRTPARKPPILRFPPPSQSVLNNRVTFGANDFPKTLVGRAKKNVKTPSLQDSIEVIKRIYPRSRKRPSKRDKKSNSGPRKQYGKALTPPRRGRSRSRSPKSRPPESDSESDSEDISQEEPKAEPDPDYRLTQDSANNDVSGDERSFEMEIDEESQPEENAKQDGREKERGASVEEVDDLGMLLEEEFLEEEEEEAASAENAAAQSEEAVLEAQEKDMSNLFQRNDLIECTSNTKAQDMSDYNFAKGRFYRVISSDHEGWLLQEVVKGKSGEKHWMLHLQAIYFSLLFRDEAKDKAKSEVLAPALIKQEAISEVDKELEKYNPKKIPVQWNVQVPKMWPKAVWKRYLYSIIYFKCFPGATSDASKKSKGMEKCVDYLNATYDWPSEITADTILNRLTTLKSHVRKGDSTTERGMKWKTEFGDVLRVFAKMRVKIRKENGEGGAKASEIMSDQATQAQKFWKRNAEKVKALKERQESIDLQNQKKAEATTNYFESKEKHDKDMLKKRDEDLDIKRDLVDVMRVSFCKPTLAPIYNAADMCKNANMISGETHQSLTRNLFLKGGDNAMITRLFQFFGNPKTLEEKKSKLETMKTLLESL